MGHNQDVCPMILDPEFQVILFVTFCKVISLPKKGERVEGGVVNLEPGNFIFA